MTDDARQRVLEAAVAAFGRVGIAKSTVEDVASAAGVARASVYRWFPGGREQLVAEAIAFEVGKFFDGLTETLMGVDDLAERLERTLQYAQSTLAAHEVLQRVLETEPERLLPHLSDAGPIMLATLRQRLLLLLADQALRPGLDAEDAADWLSRMLLSFIVSPGGWDLDDPAAVRQLVRGHLLAGVLVDDP
ncbi:MAG TPA: TetR/AcrR family transcriptional regulator [Acidimicrobiales bacterium]|nr:TetR/AcrR family transcriptional regulator [Acidimicrobiales bacterium]